jgi:hypothetical protein
VATTEDREQLRSLAEHLVGPAEIGDLLQVEPNTINVWKVRHPDFPQPVRRLKTGDVWDVREVRSWAEQTGRYPPRSSTEQQPTADDAERG